MQMWRCFVLARVVALSGCAVAWTLSAGCESDDEGSAANGGTGSGGGSTRGGTAAGTGASATMGGGSAGRAPTGGRAATGGASPTGGRSSGGSGADAGAAGDPGTSGTSSGDAGSANSGLPEGDQGIAAKHPGDENIAGDPAVVFADDFESYDTGADLIGNWHAVYQNQYVGITRDTENVFAGQQALEFTLPQQDEELSDATDKLLTEERDLLFLRYYSKFMPPYDVVGSSHNGASISAHYFDDGRATPGIPADGTNKFLANLEHWRGEAETPSPGLLNVYVYHPEQRSEWGDHFFPTGLVMPNTSLPFDFGPGFVSRPELSADLDRWYCYEYMVKANTPGARDGRIAVWIDGELKADFPGLRLRDVASLKIDRFGLSFHIGSNPKGEAKKWYDNVVAATSYIGPRLEP
jgi:hypothetical protein